MNLIIDIPEDMYYAIEHRYWSTVNETMLLSCVANGTPLPKGHGRLKDEDEIVKAIEDRVKFLRKNDAIFMRLCKDIDILGCIPKIRHEVPTIIEADNAESEDKCSNCAKSWTDECPRDKCWDNNYSKFIEESEVSE